MKIRPKEVHEKELSIEVGDLVEDESGVYLVVRAHPNSVFDCSLVDLGGGIIHDEYYEMDMIRKSYSLLAKNDKIVLLY